MNIFYDEKLHIFEVLFSVFLDVIHSLCPGCRSPIEGFDIADADGNLKTSIGSTKFQRKMNKPNNN
jgi:hypothetical protein